MLTIFAIPKAFKGHIGVIQRNAITSWTLLRPRPEIILFGAEEGTQKIAEELEVTCVPEVECNEFGTPLLNDLFQQAEKNASNQFLCYVNADIVLLDDFMDAIKKLQSWRANFLMVGRRWDLDVTEPLEFEIPNWDCIVRDSALLANRQCASNWIDYFVFARGFAQNVLPFAIGRTRWDNWLVWHALSIGYPVVDASKSVMAIHQSHDYSHRPNGYNGVWSGEEARRNAELAGGRQHHCTTDDATHRLSYGALSLNYWRWCAPLKRACVHYLQPAWFSLLNFTRPVRHRLGIRQRGAA